MGQIRTCPIGTTPTKPTLESDNTKCDRQYRRPTASQRQLEHKTHTWDMDMAHNVKKVPCPAAKKWDKCPHANDTLAPDKCPGTIDPAPSDATNNACMIHLHLSSNRLYYRMDSPSRGGAASPLISSFSNSIALKAGGLWDIRPT